MFELNELGGGDAGGGEVGGGDAGGGDAGGGGGGVVLPVCVTFTVTGTVTKRETPGPDCWTYTTPEFVPIAILALAIVTCTRSTSVVMLLLLP